jgi:drug/metabolite transporter (DMT)-like permease
VTAVTRGKADSTKKQAVSKPYFIQYILRLMKTRPSTLAWAAWLGLCLIWGSTGTFIRMALLHGMQPMALAGWRHVTAGSLLLMIMRLKGEAWPSLRQWGDALVVGLLVLTLGNGTYSWAMGYLPSGLGSLMMATQVFWMVGLETLLPHGDKPRFLAVIGLLVGFLGIVLLLEGPLTISRATLIPFLSIQLAALGNTGGALYLRHRRSPVNPIMSAAAQLLLGGLALWILALSFGQSLKFPADPVAQSSLIYLIVIGSLLGYLCFVYSMQMLPADISSLYAYINPVVAIYLGWLFLSEPMSVRTWVSAGIILAGVALVQFSEKKKVGKI